MFATLTCISSLLKNIGEGSRVQIFVVFVINLKGKVLQEKGVISLYDSNDFFFNTGTYISRLLPSGCKIVL